ncbi:hypothetical protein PYW07_010346 [Mythimna separata]|uniref:Uncharacterized protein n=1 Tax=Mythimna separata TaxID=271217 RepID=A0AAD7Y9N7_MYTSE|nr:hypothetical protein PYW07_010346 [Mythimna separata]
MRPPYVACAVSVKADGVCVWGAGSALVSRDVWGRWQLMRPPYVACAVSVKADGVCVWGAGSALVSRDVWGRWQLVSTCRGLVTSDGVT